MTHPLEIAREFLFKRRRTYRRVFDLENPDVQLILSDLLRFCKGAETTMHADERASAMLEGRRQVWLRLQHHLNLSEEELWAIYSRKDQNV